MKIAFDEHIPPAMARMFTILAEEKQFFEFEREMSLERACDYAPKRTDPDYLRRNDVPWLKRFAANGGKVVISGNTKMWKLPHERMALIECGFVTIFFEPQWNNWKFHRKCALLLHWWPLVLKTIKTAPPSSFWAIPCDWPSDGALRSLPTSDKKLLKIQRQIAARDTVRKRRSAAKVDPAQSDLEFEKVAK